MLQVNIEITQTAQNHIKDALKWKTLTSGEDKARQVIKANINDWRNQLLVLPESGKPCQYFASDDFREMIKGDYRYVYEIEKTPEGFNIYLLIFCHVRMDYQTLLRNTVSM